MIKYLGAVPPWGMSLRDRVCYRFREGSTGGEIFSCLAIIVLSSVWLINPPLSDPPPGVLYRVASSLFPVSFLVVVLCIGIAHAVSLCMHNVVPWLIARKLAAAFEAATWMVLVVDLYRRQQVSWSVIIGIMVLLLLIAVFRRSYPPL